MTQYDSDVLQKEADRIYDKADNKRWAYGSAGFVLGMFGLAGIASGNPHPEPNWAWLVFLAIPTLTGYFVGREAAHRLHVKAQLILVHVQIERNSRPQNQALLPTTTAVTPAASHPSRQP